MAHSKKRKTNDRKQLEYFHRHELKKPRKVHVDKYAAKAKKA